MRDKKNGFEGVLDALKDGIIVVDKELRLIYANQMVLDILGLSHQKEVLGRTCHEVFYDKDGSCDWRRVGRFFEKAPTQMSIPDSSGNVRFFDLYAYPSFESGNTVCQIVEAAKEDKGSAELEAQIKKLATIADTSADAMMSVDLEGRFEFWNKGAEKLLGYKKPEILGRDFRVIVPEDLHEEAETKRRIALEKGHVRYETFRVRKDGTRVPVDMTLTLIKDEEGDSSGIAGSLKDLTEKKKLEEDYKNLFENARDGISLTDREGNLLLFNSRFIEMTAFTERELREMRLPELVHPKDRDRVAAYDRERLTGGDAPKAYEFRLLRKDKSVIEVEVTASPVIRNGEVVGTQGILRDVTEREELEDEIRETKRHLESIFDTIQEAICVINSDLDIISFNDAFLKIISAPRNKVLGRKCYEVLHDYSEEEFENICREGCIVLEALEKGEPVESIHSHEVNGEFIFHEVRALPTKNQKGEIYQVVYVVNDITKQRRSEEALRFFAQIQNQISEIIFTIDQNQRILTLNSAGLKTFGYGEEELIGSGIDLLVPDDQKDNARKFWENIQREGYVERHEEVMVTKDGKRIPLELSGVMVSGDDKLPPYVIWVARDITERKKAERALLKYATELEHSNKLKELFSDIMRHDLLNPLGVVKNVIELVEEDLRAAGNEDEIRIVKRNLEKIEDLIHTASKLGQVEGSEDMEFEPRDLGEILREVFETLKGMAGEKNISIVIPGGNYLAEVNVFIEDVFSNLISNAIKYSPEDTEVSVEIDDGGDHWKIRVADNGLGVPDEHKEAIFERFKRVEKGSVKGSGLGLAIVKKVLELHKGSVWVEDNQGGGSVFAFTLPKKRI